MKKLDILAAALVIVGALNWGLVAIAEFDLAGKSTKVLAAVYEIAQPRSVLRSWGRDRHVATA